MQSNSTLAACPVQTTEWSQQSFGALIWTYHNFELLDFLRFSPRNTAIAEGSQGLLMEVNFTAQGTPRLGLFLES